MRDDPRRPAELIAACRSLMARPWLPAETDPALFAVIRRHADVLDRWFTQRFGYRLVLDADTARLVKSGHVPPDRPLRTHTGRAFTGREYVALALVLAATASGPDRISLRDLVLQIRSAAADADVTMDEDGRGRRALVTALRWLIGHGVFRELDRSVAGYEADATADALLEIRNDRLVMLQAPPLIGAGSIDDLLGRARGEQSGRAAIRRRLFEDPVLPADDVAAEDWAELRRRLGEEIRFSDEMFGFLLEARAEGVAVIDVDGGCSDIAFPAEGTTAHAALLLLEALAARHRAGADLSTVDLEFAELIDSYGRYWRKDAVADPVQLRTAALSLLEAMDLVTIAPGPVYRPRPVAARFAPEVTIAEDPAAPVQESLL